MQSLCVHALEILIAVYDQLQSVGEYGCSVTLSHKRMRRTFVQASHKSFL